MSTLFCSQGKAAPIIFKDDTGTEIVLQKPAERIIALYGAFNPVSVYKYSIDEEACIKCGACRDACGMEIKVWEQPNSIDCIRCGRCGAACPKDAIKSGFCKR